ncbi:hypothetical protein Bca4012_009742 [Brassica carinata]
MACYANKLPREREREVQIEIVMEKEHSVVSSLMMRLAKERHTEPRGTTKPSHTFVLRDSFLNPNHFGPIHQRGCWFYYTRRSSSWQNPRNIYPKRSIAECQLVADHSSQ